MTIRISSNYPIRNRHILNSTPVMLTYIISKNNKTSSGYTIGNSVTKDMTSANRPSNSNIVYPGTTSPPLVTSQYFSDWGNDIFDGWGYFYLYDVESNSYFSPILTPINQSDGLITTQTISAFSRTFTINHGYPVQGIFKYDISVNDDKEFQFGGYGDMGSDSGTVNVNLTNSYVINNQDFTLYYNKNNQTGTSIEVFYFYVIPYEILKNKNTITYTQLSSGPGIHSGPKEVLSFYTTKVKKGVTIYFSKTNDVKDWIINDLKLSSSY